MAEVGTYYITIMPEMSSFTGEVKSALKSAGTSGGKTYGTSFMDVVKGSALGSAIGGFASKIGSTFMSGVSTGIKRLDTLENFPRVMQAFGYSADEASASVNKIMEHLRGLPTASQDVVSLTQAISDSTGDLNLASDAALGFNDMMLAAGASEADVATATGVLNRILGKGSATTAQWQSLMGVMPKQLDLVAESMLGQGASAMDLYAALEDGTYSYNDMLAAIAKLDKEGSGGMASFYEQAKANSIGIGSSIENVTNRIGAGWANVFKAIGQMEIHNALEGVADALKAPLDALANGITYVKGVVANSKIGENLGKIGKAIGDYFGKAAADAAPKLKEFADNLVNFIDGALQWIVDNGDLVASAISGIVAAIEGVFALKIVGTLTTLPGLLQGLWAIIAANPIVAFVAIVSAAVGALTYFFTETETGKAIWEGFCSLMSELWTGLQADWQVLCEVLSREWQNFKAWIDGIPAWWQGIMDYWSNALEEQKQIFAEDWAKIKADFAAAWDAIKQKAINVWNGIKTNVTNIANNIKTTLTNIWNTIKTTLTNIWNTIKTTVTNSWNNIKTTLANLVDGIKNNITNQWTAIKTSVTEKIESIKTSIRDKFNSAKTTALNIFDGIKNGIRDKIQWAKDQVSRIIEGIKGLFKFSWSLPAPKLPHISWHWIDIGGLLSIPQFDGISWYGKGGVFDSAALIGIGEKGKEAALPLNAKTYGEIAKGILREGGASGVVVTGNNFYVREEADIDRIAESLTRKVRRERMAMA